MEFIFLNFISFQKSFTSKFISDLELSGSRMIFLDPDQDPAKGFEPGRFRIHNSG